MKVHVVYINLLDCEAVTFAGHDKIWLKGDIDKHLAELDAGPLEGSAGPMTRTASGLPRSTSGSTADRRLRRGVSPSRNCVPIWSSRI